MVDLLGSTPSAFVRFGEENDLRILFGDSLLSNGVRRQGTDDNSICRQLANAQQVVALHFMLGQVEIGGEVLEQEAAVKCAVMKIKRRQLALAGQHNRNAGKPV